MAVKKTGDIEIGGRLFNTATGNIVAGADAVRDEDLNMNQNEINAEVIHVREDIAGLSPTQQGAIDVSSKANNNEAKLAYYICTTAANTARKDVSSTTYTLSSGGSMKIKFSNANTSNDTVTLKIGTADAKPLYYDGAPVSANNTWDVGETVEVYLGKDNSNNDVYFANNVAGGASDGVFDVSEKYPTSGVEGGNTYTLEDALAVLNSNLSASKKKGGMSIKFIQSSSNKYVQCRLMSDRWSINVSDWQGVDNEPTAESQNLVKSGGVASYVGNLELFDGIVSYNPTTWETDRRFYNNSIILKGSVLLYYKNENSVKAFCRVTYSDNTTEDFDLVANNEGAIDISKDSLNIIQIFCFFAANASSNVGNNIKVCVLQNLAKELFITHGSIKEFDDIKWGITGSVFVRSSNLDINRFFKELYIIPTYPGEFDFTLVSNILVYRKKSYTTYDRWTILFRDSSNNNVSLFDVQTNPETNAIIELVDAGSTHQRFRGYAVVDWSQIKENSSEYEYISANLTELCLDIKYSVYLNCNLTLKPLIENGYKYKGKIDTFTASPSTPKGKEFYVTYCPGTFVNFSNLVVPANNIGLLKYDGSSWSVDLINLVSMTSQGSITIFDGTVSYFGSSDWEKDRRLYDVYCSWGKTIKFTIENETGSSLWYRITYVDGTNTTVSMSSSTKELLINNNKEINEVYFFFAANAQPEGSLKIVAYANNFYYINELTKLIENSAYRDSVSSSISSGDNVLVQIQGTFKKDNEYYIQLDGNVDFGFSLRGYLNGTASVICIAYCGCTYKVVPSNDFDHIGIAYNSVPQAGNVTLKLISKAEWELMQEDFAIRLSSVGLVNRKTYFTSGSSAHAEVIGDFRAGENYEISLSGNSNSANSFLIFLYSLTETELYRTTTVFPVNRTYIFKCPVNAEKLAVIRNNIVGDVNISVNVRKASFVRETRTLPNFVGIPIAAHQGIFIGGTTIGSPRSWAKASKLGYKWIECDIQFTSDNIPVFLHDSPINANGNYIVSKADGTPVNPSDNITVSSLTYQELKGTYRWADGGEILSLIEGFGFMNMLGCNSVLEFKANIDNDTKKANLKNACLQFGVERIIYNATSTNYKVIFPTIINMGIYLRGVVALTTSDENAIEEAFAYAAQIGGASINAYGISAGVDSPFIQRMMETYGVQYHGEWGETNEKYQVASIISNNISPVKDCYANEVSILSSSDVDSADYTSVGTFTLTELSNVNLSMIADSDVIVKIQTIDKDYYGNVNVAYILNTGLYNVYVKGTGHVAEINVRY